MAYKKLLLIFLFSLIGLSSASSAYGATQIYRSVGPGATNVLASNSSPASSTISVSSGVATFSAALPDNVGVGDAVIIDTGGTDQTIDASDTLLFIHGRTDSTHYTLRTHTGLMPADIAVNDTYSIYRAYTSLANAESGTKNTSIPITFNGGNRDLVTNNEQWNIACYANETTPDSTAVTIDGWNTSAQNFIKIYTPVASNEVGASQRHSGKWDDNKYVLSPTTGYFDLYEAYTKIDGLQLIMNSDYNVLFNLRGNYSSLSNSILRSEAIGASGIAAYGIGNTYYVYNNIIYDFSYGYRVSSGPIYTKFINNTVYSCSNTGVYNNSADVLAINNIVVNNGQDYRLATFYAGSSYNISSDDTARGTNSITNATVQFADAANNDFHLSQSDTAARGAGANLTADANLPFSTDIDGQLRNPSGTGWDIGADEGTVEFTPSVMQSGGDYSTLSSWETGVQTDLVADTTRVFSHGGITGAMADNANVTGQTSGATAKVVHVTTTQILLENISGTFQNGEVVQVTAGNSVTISNNGNPASAVAKIDGAWTSAETSATISGWTTGANNYIRVYTTGDARHKGKWSNSAYRLSNTLAVMSLYNKYVEVDGLQFNYTGSNVNSLLLSSNSGYCKISNNIFNGDGSTAGTGAIGVGNYDVIFNNIIYNIKGHGMRVYGFDKDKVAYAYNNTIYNTTVSGFSLVNTTAFNLIVKNNIINTRGASGGSFGVAGGGGHFTGSDYNSMDDNEPQGAHDLVNRTFSFVSTTAGSEDFHLSQADTSAKNQGVSLANDSAFAFNMDIDGASRNASINAWDIGADETATQIYRSVGPIATSALATDSSHANTVNLASGVATFSAALSDNIGVGDAVIIDTGGTNDAIDASDTILFIKARNSSTTYQLQTNNGSVPGDIPINDTYQIYRAYTSLANAESGTKNTSIPMTFNGGNRDLVTNNEEWNFACYANGTTADTATVSVSGWNTGIQNFIKIFTPVSTSEVGVSQRHSGKWEDSRYKLEVTGDISAINSRVNYIRISGLQIKVTSSSGTPNGIIALGILSSDVTDIRVSENIIQGIYSGSASGTGISSFPSTNGSNTVNIMNNIIYGFNLGGNGISVTRVYGNVYNNTVYGCSIGFYKYSTSGPIKWGNNLAYNNTVDYSSNVGGINNISKDATSPSAGDTDCGGHSCRNQIVYFVDENNKDFHLAQSDVAARNAGANLLEESWSIFNLVRDIDGQLRNPSGAGWDIGADEGTVEFTPTVMQSGGDYSTLSSWESGVQTDLVADTTRVFSHGGITGTIADNASVTGQTSGATATVVHATTNQILLENISGTFQSGEVVQVTAGNSVTISDNGNPASAVAKIDGAWTAADTTAVTVDGWTTGADNYIKIYTTEAARHKGKWNTSKYILSKYAGIALDVIENNLKIEGLQIFVEANSSDDIGVRMNLLTKAGVDVEINNNIFKGTNINANRSGYIYMQSLPGGQVKIWNNLFEQMANTNNDALNGAVILALESASKIMMYNNTFFQNIRAIYQYSSSGGIIAKNNIAQNCVLNCYYGTFDPSSSHNISSDATAPGTNSKTNTTVSFVSTTLGSEDFHLSSTDTAARNAGTNLNSYFTTDIDGESRGESWDIGADETPTQIFRSVGPGATAALATDNSHANTVAVSGGVATFSAALPDNIGVGDAVLIDTNNDNSITSTDTILFIHNRTSSTVYTLRTHTGSVPENISSNDTYQIYRAYTSLANAESGTKNTSIPMTFNGGNRDLATNNEEWNIACYSNGTTADTNNIRIDGWNTGAQNIIKVFTPVSSNEVGVSQRHSGWWDDSKYRILNGSTDVLSIENTDNTIIDGLQIEVSGYQTWGRAGITFTASDSAVENVTASNNIVRATTTVNNANGITVIGWGGGGNNKIYNNIVYDFSNHNFRVYGGSGINKGYVYNNTSYNSPYCFWESGNQMVVSKNNLAQNCTDGFYGTWDTALSDYNISDISGDAPNATFSGGFAEVQFLDEANADFRLSSYDTAAKGVGLNLLNDANLSFAKDIRGKLRPSSPDNWSIGASEPLEAEKVKMEGSQVKMEGDVKFE